jgi:hypothetical protein
MKTVLLSFLILVGSFCANAQKVTALPEGKYETSLKTAAHKWDGGNIQLSKEGTYKLSNKEETGEYKFSVAAQRVFFVSGPLKGAHAYTTLNNNSPVIVLPVKENSLLKLESVVQLC